MCPITVISNILQIQGCMNCSQQQLWNQQNVDPQWQARNLNGSNMSLNLPPAGYYPQQYEMNLPPAGWINGYPPHDMYPMPVGMMPIYPNPGRKISTTNCIPSILIKKCDYFRTSTSTFKIAFTTTI